MNAQRITSNTNPHIKRLIRLTKNGSFRKKSGVFVVEGQKEIAAALAAGCQPETLFICPEIAANEPASEWEHIIEVPAALYNKIAYRDDSNGVVAVMERPAHTLAQLQLPDNPFILILESVEKPGNLGAIIRSADGAGVHAVIVCDERVDLYNPNVIRSSVGTIFSVPVAVASISDVQAFLKEKTITPYAAALSESAVAYTSVDFTKPSAVVLGTEHEGLSDAWLSKAQAIMIPMCGTNDSLNVSNAAAVLAYEALRQRS